MEKIKELIRKIVPPIILEIRSTYITLSRRKKRQSQIKKRNQEKINNLLNNSLPINLELGAEKNRGIEGWTYLDITDSCDLILDLTEPLPFPDGTVNMVYSSHVLEHFDYTNLINLLSECKRILKSGGKFSAAVPNARIYLDGYHNFNHFDTGKYCRHILPENYNSKIDIVNYMAYMSGYHKYMFDEENLVAILKKTGFIEVSLRKFDSKIDLENRDYESIYIIARK